MICMLKITPYFLDWEIIEYQETKYLLAPDTSKSVLLNTFEVPEKPIVEAHLMKFPHGGVTNRTEAFALLI